MSQSLHRFRDITTYTMNVLTWEVPQFR